MSNNIKLIEKQLCKRNVYKGTAVRFNADKILLPNGKTAEREYIDHPGAVAVLPILEGDRIIMVRQYRYPVGTATLEIPAGKMHGPKDNPLTRIRHELAEETGYTAKSIKKLLSFWPCCAFSNENLHIYIATGLKPGKPDPDDDEFLRTEIVPLKKAAQMIKNGRIKDSKTIISIQTYLLNKKR